MYGRLVLIEALAIARYDFISRPDRTRDGVVQDFIWDSVHECPLTSDAMFEQRAKKVLFCRASSRAVIGNNHVVDQPSTPQPLSQQRLLRRIRIDPHFDGADKVFLFCPLRASLRLLRLGSLSFLFCGLLIVVRAFDRQRWC